MDVGDRYVLGRRIGEGATACVYEAQDPVLQREVAVKVFRNVDIGDSLAQRVDEEARILGRLAHPHLLPVYDSGRDAEGHRFLVMPLVRGTTLAKLVASGPVDPREVKRIGKALAGALAHIHARAIVHRDVKPSNVLLAEDGTPYLADFGFARAVDGPALTATDCIVGTAGYLAPEQAEGETVTPAVDVYALGLVLLEALTGQREYHGTPLERATANALRPPRIPAHLGPGWQKVLRTMTARTPSVRPSAEEVNTLIDLGEDRLPEITTFDVTMELAVPGLAGESRSGASQSRPTVVSSTAARGLQPSRRRLAALGAVAFTAVAAVGVGADLLASGASADSTTPSLTTPGAGAAGQSPTSTPSPAPVLVPVATPVSVTSVTTVVSGSATAPSSATHKPTVRDVPTQPGPPKCQPGGPKGDGHGKHKCPGGGDNGGG